MNPKLTTELAHVPGNTAAPIEVSKFITSPISHPFFFTVFFIYFFFHVGETSTKGNKIAIKKRLTEVLVPKQS